MIIFSQPPEVTPFQNQPAQMPAGTVGKNGYLRLGFERRGKRTVLAELERRAPLLVQQALYWDEGLPNLPCVFIITTSGCVLQGDRMAIEIELAPRAQAYVTTQAATKIHSMDANFAAQTQRILLHDDSYLEYLPDSLIPHKNSRFVSSTHISLAPSASLLYSETLAAGRKYYGEGELFQYDLFSCSVRAERPDGRELFVDRFVVQPQMHNVRTTGVMGQFDVLGNVLFLTPPVHADQISAKISAVFNQEEQLAFGISRLPNNAGLIFKVLGAEIEPVRAKMREFWALVRQTVTGAPLSPKVAWR